MPNEQEASYRVHLKQYGLHPDCLTCQNVESCPHPQYKAPGLIRFVCADRVAVRKTTRTARHAAA